MAIRYIEIVSQAYAVSRGSDQKNVYNIYHFRSAIDAVTTSKANIETAFQAEIGRAHV